MCGGQATDGAGTVCHHHRGQQHAQAGARRTLQDWHLWLEEALSLPVCAAAHCHPGGQLCPHHLDPQGDVVQHGMHSSHLDTMFSVGIVFPFSFQMVCLNV